MKIVYNQNNQKTNIRKKILKHRTVWAKILNKLDQQKRSTARNNSMDFEVLKTLMRSSRDP